MFDFKLFLIKKLLSCENTKNFHTFATLLVENFLHVNICRKAIFLQKSVPFNYLNYVS